MTQLIVSLEDASLIDKLKQAIQMLRGVKEVKVKNTGMEYNAETMKAFQELEEGDTVVCDSFEDYKKLINDAIQD